MELPKPVTGCGSPLRSRHDDLNRVGEPIDREVSAVNSQDLIKGGIVVYEGKYDGVDVRERHFRREWG